MFHMYSSFIIRDPFAVHTTIIEPKVERALSNRTLYQLPYTLDFFTYRILPSSSDHRNLPWYDPKFFHITIDLP